MESRRKRRQDCCQTGSRGKRRRGDSGLPVSAAQEVLTAKMRVFLNLMDDAVIQDFLWTDACCMVADKYLLAMTFAYFDRAELMPHEYTRKNFFLALFLANTMEEEKEDNKYEILPWALGKRWWKQISTFMRMRDQLWARMHYRAAVSRACCYKIMAMSPQHYIWRRQRSDDHSGAVRHKYGAFRPRGPYAFRRACTLCQQK